MKHILLQFKGNENHTPFIQFVKYGIAGVIATTVHIALFYWMALNVLPALDPGEVQKVVNFLPDLHHYPLINSLLNLDLPTVSQGVRARNAMIDNTVAFLFSNLTAYGINIIWVFERGRHHPALEFIFFYAVSGVSILIGTSLMGFMIHRFGIDTSLAFGANVVVSLVINFFLRKYVIFKD